MSEEMTQDNVQESQETTASNNQESPSEPNYKQEMMKYKTQRNEEREKNTLLEAEKEKGRQKKLAEDGKYKELIAEHSATIDKLNATLESQTGIVNNYKQNLINGLTSDDERKEHYATKDVSFLEDLTKEKNLMQPPISNPKESLGAVRKTISNKSFGDMTEAEKREWHKQMTQN